MSKTAEYHILDVFTDHKFGGNQLAIFPDARNIPEQMMQNIARELNLSETVFLFPQNASGHYPMRIFTPASELPTAGHPSIGTAFWLGNYSATAKGKKELVLEQKVGPISISLFYEGKVVEKATMSQVLPVFGEIFENRKEIASLLSLKETDLMAFPIQEVSCGVPYMMVPVESIQNVQDIVFRNDMWERLKDQLRNLAIYIFTPHGQTPQADLHGRMFAPEIGIVEDPATGSANGPLACYLHHYDIMKGKLVSEQGFEMGRPSILNLEIVLQDESITEVKVGGKAVFVGEGKFNID